jgi:hypothetical protein
MLFVAPSGATFALLHIIPKKGELLYSPNGKRFHELPFRSTSGYHGCDRVEAYYAFLDPWTRLREELHHLNGTMMHGGRTFSIDRAVHSIDENAIVRHELEW